MSNAEIATSWELWCEYVDPAATMTRAEWDAMSVAERLRLMVECFGVTA